MAETKTCPKCGASLPENAPAGICPKCLMQAGLASEAEAGASPDGTATTLTSGFVPPAPEELAKHFPQLEILELLGKGGMGAVYKARQPGLDRLVAVKILPPEVAADPAFAERFTREARALAKLSHQNIVSVFDFGQADGLYYFIMEFVDGTNLRQLIEAGGLKPEEALAIVPQICEALQFAHNEGIVHRDIKPENILIDKQGRVKIADFGLAKLLGKAPAEFTLTGTHQVMGTLHYMAPEQMRGAGAVDHRADIYSLGVVFYEMLTGQLPIGKFEPPSKKVQVDVRLDEVVLRSLENEPARRYQQVSQVKTDVEAIATQPSTVSPIPETASDAIVFRRLTVINVVVALLWAALFGSLQGGYLASADWYFKKELPYTLLNTWWGVFSFWLALSLGYWWYLLAKRPDVPRRFADFVQLFQTRDPRMRRVWKAALGYAIAWSVALVVAWLQPEWAVPPGHGDAAMSLAFTAGIVLAPFACMLILRHAYGVERFQRPAENTKTNGLHVVQAPADALIVVGCIALLTAIGVSSWMWLVPTAPVLAQQAKSTLWMMAATHVGYALFILAAALLMRRLRARMFVLLAVTVVGIAVPGMLALNVVMEWGRIPQWPVMIPVWLGVPVATWATTVLFGDNVRTAFQAESERRAEARRGS